MKIGLLYEGIYDGKSLQIIIRRILLQLKPGLVNVSFVSQQAGGSIDTHIRTAAFLFYDTSGCDIAVFVSDTDGKEGKDSRIRALVSTHCRRVNPQATYAVGCPDPELEQWFLDEENSVKRYFNLPGVRLPYDNLDSKERFLKIINENLKDITASKGEVYQQIASTLDLNKLFNCSKSFKRFYNSIKKAI